MKKKLYKSVSDRKLTGVCAGFADYLNLDPTIVRIIWAIVGLSTGFGLVAYIVAALVMSDDPGYIDVD